MNKIIKALNFVATTIRNSIYLSALTYLIIAVINIGGQAAPGIRAVSPKKIKELAKYTRPLMTSQGRRYCSSSSVKYKGKSYTLTNMHCCEHTGEFESGTLRVGDSLEQILFVSDKADVCILTSSIKSKLKIASKEFKLYDPALLLGYPGGRDLTPRFGHVIVLNEPTTVDYGYYLIRNPSNYISFLTFPGNSGSPVFNSRGEVTNLLYAGPHPTMLYGVTITNKQLHQAFADMHALNFR